MSHRSYILVCALLLAVVVGAPSIAAPAPDDSQATIYIYRIKKFVGKGLEPSVYLDDVKLADMDNGRYFAVKVAPGPHVIRSNDKDSAVDQTFEAGKLYFVKVTIVTGMLKGYGMVATVTEEAGRRDMKKLKPLDPNGVADRGKQLVILTPLN
jgi:hypothetical protein